MRYWAKLFLLSSVLVLSLSSCHYVKGAATEAFSPDAPVHDDRPLLEQWYGKDYLEDTSRSEKDPNQKLYNDESPIPTNKAFNFDDLSQSSQTRDDSNDTKLDHALNKEVSDPSHQQELASDSTDKSSDNSEPANSKKYRRW